MKKRFADEQAVRILRGAESKQESIRDVCKRHDITEQTFVRWRNKLLAGVPLSQPVARVHEACADDLAVCDDLMRAVADRCPALNRTTPDVLRETFLRREGRIARKGEAWTSHVQRKTVDVLGDPCPWPFSLVYHPWMPALIHVTW